MACCAHWITFFRIVSILKAVFAAAAKQCMNFGAACCMMPFFRPAPLLSIFLLPSIRKRFPDIFAHRMFLSPVIFWNSNTEMVHAGDPCKNGTRQMARFIVKNRLTAPEQLSLFRRRRILFFLRSCRPPAAMCFHDRNQPVKPIDVTAQKQPDAFASGCFCAF